MADYSYQVIRDTREQEGQGWTFPARAPCVGTLRKKLATGDYSLAGLEDRFVIERKGSITEFAQNLVQARFTKELVRLDSFEYPFIFLEFGMSDIVDYPKSANLPRLARKKSRLTANFLMRRLHEIHLNHKVKILFVGGEGRNAASSLFKRIAEKCLPPNSSVTPNS